MKRGRYSRWLLKSCHYTSQFDFVSVEVPASKPDVCESVRTLFVFWTVEMSKWRHGTVCLHVSMTATACCCSADGRYSWVMNYEEKCSSSRQFVPIFMACSPVRPWKFILQAILPVFVFNSKPWSFSRMWHCSCLRLGLYHSTCLFHWWCVGNATFRNVGMQAPPTHKTVVKTSNVVVSYFTSSGALML